MRGIATILCTSGAPFLTTQLALEPRPARVAAPAAPLERGAATGAAGVEIGFKFLVLSFGVEPVTPEFAPQAEGLAGGADGQAGAEGVNTWENNG